jgi:hypothetical protein
MGPGVRRDDENVFPHLISKQLSDVIVRLDRTIQYSRGATA